MKKMTLLAGIAVLSVAISGCAGPVTNEDVGVVSGGVIGGLIGSQFGGGAGRVAATAAGALVGAYIGGNIGKTMDRVDQMQMQQALEGAPVGRTVVWTNPDTGYTYQVVSTKTYYRHYHQYQQPCREYTTTAIIGGKRQQVYGTACRQADGSWRVIH